MAGCIAVAGCETTGSSQTAGQLGGGALGGAIGGFLGNEIGGTAGALIGVVAGVALGGLVGGEIGRRLDEADRERASAATQQALERTEVRVVEAPAPRPTTTEPRQVDAPAKPPQRREIELVSAPRESWNSDENADVSGSATVIGADIDDDGRQCRTVREVAYIGGEELKQEVEYCRVADGGWVKTA
jgi:surface antigen